MNYSFEPSAQAELLAAIDWYLSEAGESQANEFEAAVFRAVRLLAALPSLGTPLYPGTGARCWPLRQFPYTLIYRAEAGDVCVLAVAHQSRAPGYWIPR